MKKIVNYFVPNVFNEDVVSTEKAKLLISIMLINLSAIVFALPTMLLGVNVSIFMFLACVAFIFLLIGLLFSFKKEILTLKTIANIILVASTVLINFSLFMPNAQATTSQFFVLIPLLALLLVSPKNSLLWLLIINLDKIAYTLMVYKGIFVTQNSKLDLVGEISNFLIFTCLVFFISKVFESGRSKVTLELEKEKNSIENKVAEAIKEIEEKNSEILNTNKKSEEVNKKLELKQNDLLLAFQEAENSRQELELNKQDLEEQKISLQSSVEQMLGKMEKFAKGDLTVSIYSRKNQNNNQAILELFEGFNDAVLNINYLFKLLVKAITDVEESSSQISLLTQELASGTEQQLSQTNQISASVEELASISEQNTDTILRTSETSQKNKDIANLGGELVLKTVTMMDDISAIVYETLQKVSELGKSTQKINEVSSVINDIAAQTNLLALNAAIEAARAGEHGRGFSVVADEVRKLAEKTAVSTKEIGSMIKVVQTQTNDVIKVMNQANDRVFSGITLANEAGQTLEKIVKTSEQLLEMIDHVAIASKEQTSTSRQVVTNILEIESVSNKAVDNILKISNSVSDLNRLSAGLKEISNNFKVE